MTKPGRSPVAAPILAPARVLVCGVDAALQARLRQWLREDGAELESVEDLPHAVRALATRPVELVIASVGEAPERALDEWSDALRGLAGAPRLVALAARPSMGLVLRGEHAGVLDVLALPPPREAILRALAHVRAATAEHPLALPPVAAHMVGEYALIGDSPAMIETYKVVARVAASDATVLIEGESGTGKEVVARALHQHGPRATAPFVAVNCAAIPENLLESELFGHERGAFTGAVARKIGRFERAMHGTLLLDEIADMSLPLQAKILRALQERQIDRVGGDTVPIDIRLIAATNRNLIDAIAKGTFREDLYYRLSVISLRLPRLADRGDDLMQLTAYFIREFGRQYDKAIDAITTEALDALREHPWVGNVRELRNVIERAVLVADAPTLRAAHLPERMRNGGGGAPVERTDAPPTLAEVEARHIARVLSLTHGRMSKAAEILGVHRNTLARKMREYGL